MKKILSYVLLAAVLTVSFASCSKDFMEIEPVGSVGEATLANPDGVDMLLTGAYAALYAPRSFWSNYNNSITNWVWGDMLAGDANKGSMYSDQPPLQSVEEFKISNDNAAVSDHWASEYDRISRPNAVLHEAEICKDELSAVQGEAKNQYLEVTAQARMLRAIFHFELVKTFGAAVPYISTEAYESATDPKQGNIDENGQYVYIWDKIIEDLEYAVENLPATWSNTGAYGRFNKWGAKALLAKVKLYHASPYTGHNGTEDSAANWNEVKTLLKDVIDNGMNAKGVKFALNDNYEQLWVAGQSDWTGESVLDIQTTIAGTAMNTADFYVTFLVGKTGQGGWGFLAATNDMAMNYAVDAKGLPRADFRSMNPVSTSADGQNVTTDLTVAMDPRVDVAVGRFGVPFWDYGIPENVAGWVRDASNQGYYLEKKYDPKKADFGSLAITGYPMTTAKNLHMIRTADLYLMYAEACLKTGDVATAVSYINKVRERAQKSYVANEGSGYTLEVMDNAGNVVSTQANAAGTYRIGLYPASLSAQEAWTALRRERRLELGMEGHRFFDLARWGIYQDEMNAYYDSEQKVLSKFAKCHVAKNYYCMPIPADDITTLEGKLKQSEDW